MKTTRKKTVLEYSLILLLLALGLYLRVVNVQTAQVDALRSDAIDYYAYAINLKERGIYSRQNPNLTFRTGKLPLPDHYRPPAYPLFIYPFVSYPPQRDMLQKITNAQAIVSFLTVLAVFLIGKLMLPFWLTALTTALTAISPHLIATDAYILTETLFTFILAMHLLFLCLFIKSDQKIWAIPAGMTLGLSLLIKPAMLYSLVFLLPALFIVAKAQQQAYKPVLLLLVSFIVTISPWHIRNMGLEDTPSLQKKSLTKITIQSGSYPGLMVGGDPKTQGKPHKTDPDYDKYQTFREIFGDIARRAKEKPFQYINWYTWGKMKMFFSWDVVAGWGDIFIYPLNKSAYFTSHLFQNTRAAMLHTHALISFLAFICTFIIWLPFSSSLLNRNTLLAGRYISALLLYFMAVHQVGTPLPRYSIPLRPELYIMFGIFCLGGYTLVCKKFAKTNHENPA